MWAASARRSAALPCAQEKSNSRLSFCVRPRSALVVALIETFVWLVRKRSHSSPADLFIVACGRTPIVALQPCTHTPLTHTHSAHTRRLPTHTTHTHTHRSHTHTPLTHTRSLSLHTHTAQTHIHTHTHTHTHTAHAHAHRSRTLCPKLRRLCCALRRQFTLTVHVRRSHPPVAADAGETLEGMVAEGIVAAT